MADGKGNKRTPNPVKTDIATEQSNSNILAYSIGGAIGLVVLLIIFIAVVVVFVLQRRRGETTFEKSLLTCCKQPFAKGKITDPKMIEDEWDCYRIKKEAMLMMHPKDGYKYAKKFFDEKCSISPAEESKSTITLPTCRHPDIPLFKHNKVKNLHISKLKDFFARPIYIAMEPLPSEYETFMIFLYKANVRFVVWVGPITEDTENMYFKSHETLERKTIGRVLVGGYKEKYSLPDFEQYTVRIDVIKSGGDTRYVKVFHAENWHVFEKLRAYRLKYDPHKDEYGSRWMEKDENIHWSQPYTPITLFQCSNGIDYAAPMAAVFIATQMMTHWNAKSISQIKWENILVNFPPVVRHVRKGRHGAFTHGGKSAEILALAVAHLWAESTLVGSVDIGSLDRDYRQMIERKKKLRKIREFKGKKCLCDCHVNQQFVETIIKKPTLDSPL